MQQFFPASMRHYTVTSTAVVPAAAFSAWLRRMLLSGLAAGCLLGGGCGESPVTPERRVVTVLASRDSVYLEVGDSVALRAEARDVNADPVLEVSIEWRSLDPGIATVSPGARSASVVARTAGTSRIVASSGGHADTTTILVLSPITETTLSTHADTAWAVGDTFVVRVSSQTATGGRLGHYTAVSRSSAAIAWLDAQAPVVHVTAQLVGDAYVVVTERAGTADSALIAVRQRPARVVVTPDSVLGFLERTYRLTGSVQDARNHTIPGAPVTWTSFDPAIASVDTGGLVAFRGIGTAHVAAKHAGGAADTTAVTVLPKPKLALQTLEPGQPHDSAGIGAHELSYTFYAYAENTVSPWVHLRAADTSIAAVPDSVRYVGDGATFTVRGKRTGRTVVIGEAPLLAPDSIRVFVSTPRLVLEDLIDAVSLAIRGTNDVHFGIGTADSSGARHPLADTLVVTFRSSDSTVIDLVQNRTPYVMGPGGGDNGGRVFAGYAADTGHAMVIATAHGFTSDSMAWRVVPGPTLRFQQGRFQVLGAGQTTSGQLATVGPTTGGGVDVTLTQRRPELASLPSRLTLTDATSTGRLAGYTVDALAAGRDTVIVSAAGYEPDTAVLVVTTPHILVPDTVQGTTLGGFTEVWVGDSLNVRHAPTDALFLLATSSDTTVARSSSTRIPARWLALWPLHIAAVDTGTATIVVADSAGRYLPKRFTFTAALDTSLGVAASDGYQFGPAATGQRFEDTRFLLGHPEFPPPGRVVHLSTTVPGILRIPDSVIVTSGGYTYFPGAGGDIAGTTRIVASARGFRPDTSGPIAVGQGHLSLRAPPTAFVGGTGYSVTVLALSPRRVDLPMDENLTVTLSPLDGGVAPQSPSVTVPAGQAVTPQTPLRFTAPGPLRLAALDERPLPTPFSGDTVAIQALLPWLRLRWPGYGLTVGVGQRLIGSIARPDNVIAEAATVSVTHSGSRITSAPSILLPAGAASIPYTVDGRAVGSDTLTLSAPGYAGDTVDVTVTDGVVEALNWPSRLFVGDSVPVVLQVLDSARVPHNVVAATTFAIQTSGGLSFSDGTLTINTITITADSGHSPRFYVRATTTGTASVSFVNLDYVTRTFGTTVTPPPAGAAPATQSGQRKP